MQEKTLLRLSVALMIIGLLFLFFYAQELDTIPQNSIDKFSPEEKVILHGVIKKISTQDKVIFLTVEGEEVKTTDVILFSSEDLFLRENASVEVQGLVQEYNGKKELIAQKVVMR